MRSKPCNCPGSVRRSIRPGSATPAGKKAGKGTTTHRLKKPSVVSQACPFSGLLTDSYHHGMAEEITAEERQELIVAIASREGDEDQLCKWFGRSKAWIHRFVRENRQELTLARMALEAADEEATEDRDDEAIGLVTPMQLDELWISKKHERLTRYQNIANKLYDDAMFGDEIDAVALRELRAYMQAVANELGQLLHRGSGDAGQGDVLTVKFDGVDPSESFV